VTRRELIEAANDKWGTFDSTDIRIYWIGINVAWHIGDHIMAHIDIGDIIFLAGFILSASSHLQDAIEIVAKSEKCSFRVDDWNLSQKIINATETYEHSPRSLMDYGYYVCSVDGVQKAIKLTNDIKQIDNKGTAVRIYTCIDPYVEQRKTPCMSIPVAGTQPTVQIIDSVESNY